MTDDPYRELREAAETFSHHDRILVELAALLALLAERDDLKARLSSELLIDARRTKERTELLEEIFALQRAAKDNEAAIRPMDDPDLEALKAAGAPVLLLYPAAEAPRGLMLEAAWLIDRWSPDGRAIGEPGWQHRSARWAAPVGWMALPATPPTMR